jgi:hypothetical protein
MTNELLYQSTVATSVESFGYWFNSALFVFFLIGGLLSLSHKFRIREIIGYVLIMTFLGFSTLHFTSLFIGELNPKSVAGTLEDKTFAGRSSYYGAFRTTDGLIEFRITPIINNDLTIGQCYAITYAPGIGKRIISSYSDGVLLSLSKRSEADCREKM